MPDILVIPSSPSQGSRSGFVAERVVSGLGPTVRSFGPAQFDATDVLYGRRTPAVESFIDAARNAAAVVLATPVYKGTYSGALKALVDLLPEDALLGRPLVTIATAKSAAHRAPVTDAFDALAGFFGASPVAPTLVVLDADLARDGEGFLPNTFVLGSIDTVRAALAAALRGQPRPSNPV